MTLRRRMSSQIATPKQPLLLFFVAIRLRKVTWVANEQANRFLKDVYRQDGILPQVLLDPAEGLCEAEEKF